MKRTIFLVSLVVAPFVALAINAEFGAIMFMICILALVGWLIRLVVEKRKAAAKARRRKKSTAPAQEAPRPVMNVEQPQAAADPLTLQRQAFFYNQSIGKIKYFYTDVGVYVPDLVELCSSPEAVPLGNVVCFQDPGNKYDNKAVAVCQSCGPIGYLYRGKIQDMANDWMDNGKKVIGFISYFDPTRPDANKNGLKIDIAFY